MTDTPVHIEVEWNYQVVLASLLFAVIVQSVVLPCLCPVGSIKMKVALVGDALVLVRLLIARIRHARSRGWVWYVVLPHLFAPIIAYTAFLCLGPDRG